MTASTHLVTNLTRGTLLGERMIAVNGTFEHLTVLRVLIEGLTGSDERGMWLTNVLGLPSVPRISPIDLVYLDKDQRVVEAIELLPAAVQPEFRAPSVSALALPFQTISATQTRPGDQLAIEVNAPLAAEPEEAEPAPAELEPTAVPVSVAESVFASAMQMPLVPSSPQPQTRPLPVLTVREAVLPDAMPEVAASSAAVEGAPKRIANIKRSKSPRARKVRQTVARTQKQKENAATEQQRKIDGFMAAAAQAEPVVIAPPVAVPPATAATMPATASTSTGRTPVPAAGKVPERGRFMAMINRVLRWLNPDAIDVEQRSSIRRPTGDLVAYVGQDGEQVPVEVSNISSSGVYLRTEERWEPGTKVPLTLQRSGPPADVPERRVEIEAHAVRHGKDGVGLAFALPQGMHLDLWESAAGGDAGHSGPEYIVYEMRIAQALGLIRSISPDAVEESRGKLRKDFSSVRVRDAIRVLQIAEKMLVRRDDFYALQAPAHIVLRILDMSSWASEQWTQELWAGMLATSCTSGGMDQSNADLVELLCQLAPVHLRILELASARCDECVEKGGMELPSFTIQELTKLLDLSNQTKTLRSVGEMADRGLMTPAKRPPTDPNDDNARTSVTPLGLKLHARCHGRMEF